MAVRNTRVTLHKALEDARRRGHVLQNVADAVDPPARGDSVERMAWTAAEVRKFLVVVTADRLHAAWRLALATGLRRGELLGLRWDDVEEGSVHVRRQVLLRPRLGVQGDWIVTEADGAVVHPDTLLGRWRRLVETAGVPVIPFAWRTPQLRS
jgi:integrase